MSINKCELCPRKCGIDRTVAVGFCGQSDTVRVARAAPHMWEEPCISGKNGSGTVFFCGCTLGCVYCQNSAISRGSSAKHGVSVTPDQLADVFLRLQSGGVHNINLVTPTMFSDVIAEALNIARGRGLALPIVYNTSGYETPEGLSKIAAQIDIYMPDFKYISSDIAAKYSRAADYPHFASESLRYMYGKIGPARFDENGMMTRGIIVRHLLLPGQLAESKRVLDHLFGEYGNSIWYSLMSQYTPMPTLDTEKYPELNRLVTTYEYQKLIDHAVLLGIKNGFVQEKNAAKESFIPSFNGEGVN